jgi:hypothetical protein
MEECSPTAAPIIVQKKSTRTATYKHCAFVWEIEFLEIGVPTLRKVPDHLAIVSTGLNDNSLRSVIVKKQIMRN